MVATNFRFNLHWEGTYDLSRVPERERSTPQALKKALS